MVQVATEVLDTRDSEGSSNTAVEAAGDDGYVGGSSNAARILRRRTVDQYWNRIKLSFYWVSLE